MSRKNRGDLSAGNGMEVYARCWICEGTPPQTCKNLRCSEILYGGTECLVLHTVCQKHWKLAPRDRKQTTPAN